MSIGFIPMPPAPTFCVCGHPYGLVPTSSISKSITSFGSYPSWSHPKQPPTAFGFCHSLCKIGSPHLFCFFPLRFSILATTKSLPSLFALLNPPTVPFSSGFVLPFFRWAPSGESLTIRCRPFGSRSLDWRSFQPETPG